MRKILVSEKNIGHVKIFKDEIRYFEAFEDYKNLPNGVVEREGTADEYVSFKTFSTKGTKNTVWLLEQYDIWLTTNSRRIHGVFSSREKALESIGYETDGFKKNYYENGTNLWMSKILEIGIAVREVELDEFGEV